VLKNAHGRVSEWRNLEGHTVYHDISRLKPKLVALGTKLDHLESIRAALAGSGERFQCVKVEERREILSAW
jgi:hypothetical protein